MSSAAALSGPQTAGLAAPPQRAPVGRALASTAEGEDKVIRDASSLSDKILHARHEFNRTRQSVVLSLQLVGRIELGELLLDSSQDAMLPAINEGVHITLWSDDHATLDAQGLRRVFMVRILERAFILTSWIHSFKPK